MRWPNIVRSSGIGAVTAALVVSGCGSNEEAAPPAIESERASSMVMPITSYMPTTHDYVVLQRAHGMLVEKCMAARGFDWEPPSPYTGDTFGRQVNRRYRYVLDSDVAAKFG